MTSIAEATSTGRDRRMLLLRQAYYVTMVVLALAIIALIGVPEEETWVHEANFFIWLVFAIDYVVRFLRAPRKLLFVRQHLIDLIAIIPFEVLLNNEEFALARMLRLLRFARLTRLIWLIRAGAILWRMSRTSRGILHTNGVGYVLAAAVVVAITGGIALWAVEPDIGAPADGIWWAFVTTTTVGYGDIAPKTMIGRGIAVVLMMLGIGCISMLSASIATYFLGKQTPTIADPHIAHIAESLGRWDEMRPHERVQLARMLALLAESAEPEPAGVAGEDPDAGADQG